MTTCTADATQVILGFLFEYKYKWHSEQQNMCTAKAEAKSISDVGLRAYHHEAEVSHDNCMHAEETGEQQEMDIQKAVFEFVMHERKPKDHKRSQHNHRWTTQERIKHHVSINNNERGNIKIQIDTRLCFLCKRKRAATR